MFTIEQIDDLHTRLGSAKTLPEYVRALNALGVERYDSYLTDGHSEYFGQGGQRVVSPPVHEVLVVAETSQRDTFLEHLRRHDQCQTTMTAAAGFSPAKKFHLFATANTFDIRLRR